MIDAIGRTDYFISHHDVYFLNLPGNNDIPWFMAPTVQGFKVKKWH